jgi:hypothetical protein
MSCEGGRHGTCDLKEECAKLGQMFLRSKFGGQRMSWYYQSRSYLSQNSSGGVVGYRKIKTKM